ncbi:MAG: hypothetical protein ACW980_25580 [Promethearchaeota archaeon]|jgi:hypothetical protein
MGGFVTWIGIGITALLTGYEAIIAQNPEIAGALGAGAVIVIGVARKIEKAIKAFQEGK